MSFIYTNVSDKMKQKRYKIRSNTRYDTTDGSRDRQFIKRGVEPLFTPTWDSLATFMLPIVNIVDLIHKDIMFTFDSGEDLADVVSTLDEYLEQFKNINMSSIPKTDDSVMFLERCRGGLNKLKLLNRAFDRNNRHKSPTYMPSADDAFDLLMR